MHQIAQAIETHGIGVKRQHGRNGAPRQPDFAVTIVEIAALGPLAFSRDNVEAAAAPAQRAEDDTRVQFRKVQPVKIGPQAEIGDRCRRKKSWRRQAP